jgi:hypothetical protein
MVFYKTSLSNKLYIILNSKYSNKLYIVLNSKYNVYRLLFCVQQY